MNVVVLLLIIIASAYAYEQRRTVSRTSSKSKTTLKGSSRKGSSLSSKPLQSNMLLNIKNEIVDCYDSLAKAKSHEERVKAAKSIALRHSGAIMGGAGAILLYKAISRKRYLP